MVAMLTRSGGAWAASCVDSLSLPVFQSTTSMLSSMSGFSRLNSSLSRSMKGLVLVSYSMARNLMRVFAPVEGATGSRGAAC